MIQKKMKVGLLGVGLDTYWGQFEGLLPRLFTLIISVGYADGDDMHIGGMDSKSNHLIWMNKKMSLGDKIKVRVREIDIASPLHMRYPSDREEMKKEYYKLKKKLEEEGKL